MNIAENWVPRWGLRSTNIIAPTTQVLYSVLVPEVRNQGNSNLVSPLYIKGNRRAVEAFKSLTELFHDIDLIWNIESEEHIRNILSK
jgi:hypothetical protein